MTLFCIFTHTAVPLYKFFECLQTHAHNADSLKSIPSHPVQRCMGDAYPLRMSIVLFMRPVNRAGICNSRFVPVIACVCLVQ